MCFYCNVQAVALEGALACFAALIAGPLLKAEWLEQEIQAINSKHVNNKQQDHWQIHQLA